MHVAVFCASNPGRRPVFAAAAAALGRTLGAGGHTLVWGGCNVGLMAIVGRATLQAGGGAIAVIPEFLVERGLAFENPTERIVTPDLATRKTEMRRLADAYVALPGGVGTWEEVLEVLALKKLGRLAAPIWIANLEGCYDGLLLQIRSSLEDGLSPIDLEQHFESPRTIEDLCARVAACS